jgi:hypothetical protein
MHPVEEGAEVEGNESPIWEEEVLPVLSTPRAQLATAESIILQSPSRASGPLTQPVKRKRASDSERQNLYEVPAEASQDSFESEEAPPNRPTKRARGISRAKHPLAIPKTSKALISSRQTRQTKGNQVAEREDMTTAADVPASNPVKEARAINSIEAEQSKPKKRGRPPKRKTYSTPVMPRADTASTRKTAADSHAVVKGVEIEHHPGVTLQAPGGMGESISEIPLNLSPMKVVRQLVGNATSTGKRQEAPKPKGRIMTANRLPELSADEDESEGDDGDAGEPALLVPEDEEVEEEDQEVEETRRTPFDPDLIDRMWETSKKVGHKFSRENNTWSQDGKVQNISTPIGKKMTGQLQRLISSYEKLQNSKASQDEHAFGNVRREVEKEISALSEEAVASLTKRFCSGSDPKEAREMLTDLYFNLIPQCIHALKWGVGVYNNQGSMETPALQEILKLVDLLHNMANIAVTQPREIQPKPAEKSSYQISQPTRKNLRQIRDLQKEILKELSFRAREEQRPIEERLQAERGRQLLEDNERKEAELRRKLEERRRLQGESWRAVRDLYVSDALNPTLQTDMANFEAAREGNSRQGSSQLSYPRTSRGDSRRAGSEESCQTVERVKVFPANNVKADSSMKSLSKDDTLIFIDCMRYEQGKETLGFEPKAEF